MKIKTFALIIIGLLIWSAVVVAIQYQIKNERVQEKQNKVVAVKHPVVKPIVKPVVKAPVPSGVHGCLQVQSTGVKKVNNRHVSYQYDVWNKCPYTMTFTANIHFLDVNGFVLSTKRTLRIYGQFSSRKLPKNI